MGQSADEMNIININTELSGDWEDQFEREKGATQKTIHSKGTK